VSFDAKEFLQSLFGMVVPVELPSEWLEDYQDRLAILENAGGLTREEAEAQALQEIMERIRDAERI